MKTMSIIAILIVITAIDVCANTETDNLTDFYHALEQGDDETAFSIGQKIFGQIERQYRADSNLGNLKSKLVASEFLGNQMIEQLQKATRAQLLSVSDDIFATQSSPSVSNFSIPAAISFYETSKALFSRPVSIDNFKAEEKLFLARYYDLKLRIITSSIAKAGQALAVAEPDFRGTHNYVLVLPLLHSSENISVNINILPKWMRQSSQLEVFSDSCLMHYGYPYHAKTFAKKAAIQNASDFSEIEFYISAGQKCSTQLPRVAVDCLQRAIDRIDDNKTDQVVSLKFDIIQIWQDSGNFSLAAGVAKKVIDQFSGHDRFSDANWLYYYSLSRANNAESILSGIDSAISDPRCSGYRPRLLYIKWWALRRQRDQGAALAAVEHQLISQYSDTEIVAPVMLSRATDLLARQEYSESLALLKELQEKFPSTTAAQQASRIADRLTSLQQ